MAKRGRKPGPTAMKLLRGAQPCRINLDEPPAKVCEPARPDYVASDAIARSVWDELAPILARLRVLTEGDRHALGMLCLAFAQWRRSPGDLKYATQLRRMLCEFGLTPSSRSTLKVGGTSAAESELSAFLARRKA